MKGLHYSLLSNTLAKLPVLFFKGITQNMHIMMFHLKHQESHGEVSFLLFKTGSPLEPQACIYRHSCTCDASSHSCSNLKSGWGSVKLGPLANVYKIWNGTHNSKCAIPKTTYWPSPLAEPNVERSCREPCRCNQLPFQWRLIAIDSNMAIYTQSE